MFMVEYRSIDWWYWLVTVGFLTAGISGWQTGFVVAIGLTVLQLIHFTIRERSVSAFPVQVRLGYLLLLLFALPESFRLIYWLPTIGTWAQVLFGYCAMARTVSLLPWNCKKPFSFGHLRRTFFSAPVRGNIMQGLPST
jgi:hypothetical protein